MSREASWQRPRSYDGRNRPAGGVPDHGPFPPDRLRDEVARRAPAEEDGGVELDELHIGEERPGPERHRYPLTGGDGRVRALPVEAPGAAGRQDHRPWLGLLNAPPVGARQGGDDLAPLRTEASEHALFAGVDPGIEDARP